MTRCTGTLLFALIVVAVVLCGEAFGLHLVSDGVDRLIAQRGAAIAERDTALRGQYEANACGAHGYGTGPECTRWFGERGLFTVTP